MGVPPFFDFLAIPKNNQKTAPQKIFFFRFWSRFGKLWVAILSILGSKKWFWEVNFQVFFSAGFVYGFLTIFCPENRKIEK